MRGGPVRSLVGSPSPNKGMSRRGIPCGSCLACAVHLVWNNDLIAWPLQPCCEKLDDSGDIALIKVAQGSVFCHLNDPKPGIRQYCAEQFPAFCYAQSIGIGGNTLPAYPVCSEHRYRSAVGWELRREWLAVLAVRPRLVLSAALQPGAAIVVPSAPNAGHRSSL